jgi:hypothetical protein
MLIPIGFPAILMGSSWVYAISYLERKPLAQNIMCTFVKQLLKESKCPFAVSDPRNP